MRGLSLCGGGIRCAAQVGALQIMERHGLEFDVVAGVSMGSVVAAAYAMGWDLADFEQFWLRLQRREVLGITVPGVPAIASRRFRRFLNSLCRGRRIEQLPRRLLVLATDLTTGRRVVFERGDLAEVLYASCALPGLLQPVQVGGHWLVDGGVADPIPPAALLRERGADHVTAIYFKREPNQEVMHRPGGLWGLLWRCGAIMAERLAEEVSTQFDTMLHVNVADIGLTDHRSIPHCLQEGRTAAEALMAELGSPVRPTKGEPAPLHLH